MTHTFMVTLIMMVGDMIGGIALLLRWLSVCSGIWLWRGRRGQYRKRCGWAAVSEAVVGGDEAGPQENEAVGFSGNRLWWW